MPIDINQLNTYPLAALAGGRVTRLGLEAYPIDIGAPAQGMATGYWKAQDLQERYAQQNTLVNIEKMKQQGQLTTDQADNLTKAAIAEYNQKQANLRQASVNAIQQQNADTNRMNAGTNQYNAGIDAQYKVGQLGVAQQNANQTGAYQQGQLAIGQGNLDVNKQKAQDEMLQRHFEMGLKMDDRKREGIAQVSAIIGQIGQATNGDANKAMPLINNALAEAKKMGIDTSMFEGKSFNDMMNTSVYTSLLNQKVEQAKGAAAQKGLQITTDDNGNLITKPLAEKLDPNSPEALANKTIQEAASKKNQAIESGQQTTDKLIQDTQQGMDLLKKIPSMYTGPIAGRLGLGMFNTDVQELDKILAGIPLIQKSATLGQTAGQRLFQSELEMMKKSSGSLNINAPALKWILQEQNTEAKISKWKGWHTEFTNIKEGSPSSVQNWLSNNPQPEEPLVEVVSPSGQHGTVPYSQLDNYLKNNKGAQRW